MNRSTNISKFLAWMDLFYEGDNTDLLRCSNNEQGERCFTCFVPNIEKEISGTDKNPEKALDKFFKNFIKELDLFLHDKPEIKFDLERQIKINDDKHNKELEEYRARHKVNKNFHELHDEILTKRFNDDLNMAISTINLALTDVALILNEDVSRLYIKVVGRPYFDEQLSESQITEQMNYMCRSEIKEKNQLFLFTNCRVTSDIVLLIGVLDQM